MRKEELKNACFHAHNPREPDFELFGAIRLGGGAPFYALEMGMAESLSSKISQMLFFVFLSFAEGKTALFILLSFLSILSISLLVGR